MSDLIAVRAFATRAEAELAKDLLQTQGVTSVLMSNDAGGARPELAFTTGGARLLVASEDAQRAVELLKGLGLQHADDATRLAVNAQARGCIAPAVLGMALIIVAGFAGQIAGWLGNLIGVVALALIALAVVRGTRAA
jgi:hypothetical protein